ncbi:isoleucine--tRNA ligase, partial [Chytridiales sp. JEL 0842]
FDEKGLKSLIAAVFLPWYNSYRFFFSQLALLKKEHNYDFVYNPDKEIKMENVMDQWILASTQSLIQFVREEMAAYRLYTVVPKLLGLIDDLTNWYIRFNRKRLKGENGLEDASQALTTLFEVLFTLCKMMSPFTPFLAETMYQNLRTCIAEDPNVDTRSVHFLMFPTVKSHYFNPDIERSVGRMQRVIELGRYIREKKGLPLKTPLRELVSIHPDEQFRSDVLSLESYIKEELNIKTLTATAEEKAYGVRYELRPDNKVLGQRLGKEFAKVRKALTTISESQVNEYVSNNRLVLEGIELLEKDFEVLRIFEGSAGSQAQYEAKSEGGVLVILDLAVDPALIEEGVAREVVNRVQRLRKKAGLVPTDDIKYYMKITNDPEGKLAKAIQGQSEYLMKSLKQEFLPLESRPADAKVIAEEEQEIEETKFMLLFV